MQVHQLTRQQRERLLEKELQFFLYFCRKEFSVTLYAYQVKVARALLSSIIVERKTVFVKIARQAGKTEVLTLIFKFLILYYLPLLKRPLMAGIASPKGEQAKTDIDRIKKSVQQLRERWNLEDRENNQATIRAYRNDKLHCEMYRFSLMPTTSNESKTLNVLAIEESHKSDHQKRSDELDPMLASTGGVTWHFGVGCTELSDYKLGCDGQIPDSLVVLVDVDEVIRDRRAVYEQTGDPIHLEYEKAFSAELRQKGRQNPEIRRNYYLEDMVEAGNFISRERFLSCGRKDRTKNGILIPCEDLTLSIDWARHSDYTWAGLMNRKNDLIDFFKYPHVRYEEQIEMLLADLKQPRHWSILADGQEVVQQFTYFDRIGTVRGDASGLGDFPMEYLQDHSGLPISEDSRVKFTPESKNEMFTMFEAALFRDPGDPLRFSYPSDHPLAAELEEQMTALLREYKTERELLSPHAPETPGAYDDAPVMCALGCLGAAQGVVGDILFA